MTSMMRFFKIGSALVPLFIGFSSTTFAQHSPALTNCPGVDPYTGQRPSLTVQFVEQATLPREDRIPVPPEFAEPALEIIGSFESGPDTDPFTNVNDTDTISIGFMQWNWSINPGFRRFFNGLSDSDISRAPLSLQEDLRVLRAATSKAEMEPVIRSWTTAGQNDPLDEGIRTSTKLHLGRWLGTSEMRSYQYSQIDGRLRLAYSYARKWLEDSPTRETDLSFVTAYFFDLVVYNGGRAGLWRPHVTDIRNHLGSDQEVIDFVADWLRRCAAFSFDGNTQHKKIYGRQDALKNSGKWTELALRSQFSETQIELLLLGYLRASLSFGNNGGRGFHGVFQADVMTRRGVLALGEGYVHGSYRELW